MIEQSCNLHSLFHDDIPGYNLPTLDFVLPPVNDDENLILEEENPEIYVHLENVLVHMIYTQDVAIFKSQKDYVRNKQNLSEYICDVGLGLGKTQGYKAHQKCLLPRRPGCRLNRLNYSPTEGSGGVRALRSSPG